MFKNILKVQVSDTTKMPCKTEAGQQKDYGNFLNKVKLKIISITIQINPANKKGKNSSV